MWRFNSRRWVTRKYTSYLGIKFALLRTNSLCPITTHRKHSEQHVELRASRKRLDYNDCLKFNDWLCERNTFRIKNEHLFSLSAGLMAVHEIDGVDCDKCEEIGYIGQQNTNKF